MAVVKNRNFFLWTFAAGIAVLAFVLAGEHLSAGLTWLSGQLMGAFVDASGVEPVPVQEYTIPEKDYSTWDMVFLTVRNMGLLLVSIALALIVMVVAVLSWAHEMKLFVRLIAGFLSLGFSYDEPALVPATEEAPKNRRGKKSFSRRKRMKHSGRHARLTRVAARRKRRKR